MIVQRPHIEEEVVNENRSRFIVEPLEPGFGYTLGNTLRRTLLARIPGAAITNVRIEGVQHEFSTIPGVVEDVVDIILNLKGVVLRIEVDGPQTLYLSAKGKGDVTAGDIKAPAGVEVINEDHHLASLSTSGKLEIGPVVKRRRARAVVHQDVWRIPSVPVKPIFSTDQPHLWRHLGHQLAGRLTGSKQAGVVVPLFDRQRRGGLERKGPAAGQRPHQSHCRGCRKPPHGTITVSPAWSNTSRGASSPLDTRSKNRTS